VARAQSSSINADAATATAPAFTFALLPTFRRRTFGWDAAAGAATMLLGAAKADLRGM
jgi:hypothetical protein